MHQALATGRSVGGGAVEMIIGTANQIAVSSATGDVTLSIPAVFIAPGSIQATGNITFGTANSILSGTTGSQGITVTGTNQSWTVTPSGNGNFVVATNGAGSTLVSTNAVSSAFTNVFNGLAANLSAGQAADFVFGVQTGGTYNAGDIRFVYQATNSSSNSIDFGFAGVATPVAKLLGNTHLLLGGLTTDGTGVLQFPAATTSAGGITFGADVNLYRSGTGAATLVGTSLSVGVGADNAAVIINSAGGNNAQFIMQRATGTFFSIIQDGSGGAILRTGGSSTTALTLDSSQNATFAGNATLAGTKLAKFGATANATIGVSADTTAGNFVVTSTTTGNISLVTANGTMSVGNIGGSLQSLISSANLTFGNSPGNTIQVRSSGGLTTMQWDDSQYVTQNGVRAAASTSTKFVKAVAAIADNVATAVLTVTIPNAAHSAQIHVTLAASLGAGGAIGANEATAVGNYDIVVTRTAGVATGWDMATVYGNKTAAVVGGATITLTTALSALSGGVGATQTFTLNVTIAHGSGSSTNHTCQVIAQVLNANASGVTIA